MAIHEVHDLARLTDCLAVASPTDAILLLTSAAPPVAALAAAPCPVLVLDDAGTGQSTTLNTLARLDADGWVELTSRHPQQVIWK